MALLLDARKSFDKPSLRWCGFAIFATVLITDLQVRGYAQPLDKLPTFDVAEIKLSKPNAVADSQLTKAGHFRLAGVSLRLLMSSAWQVKEDQVVGGPGWLDTQHFDVVANLPAASAPGDVPLMLRSLLIETFGLAIHKDEKLIGSFALLIEKGGARLKDSAADSSEGVGGCVGGREGGMNKRTCRNVSMQVLADVLPFVAPHYIDAPVENLTGLKGRYDFTLLWRPHQQGTKREDGTPVGPTIFDSLSELGLKLESKKLPIPIIVVDRVQQLTVDH